MPIYEFYCASCNSKTDILIRSGAPESGIKCSSCGSDLRRIVSRFAIHKSVKTVHEESGNPGMYQNPDYLKDPRNIGRWVEDKFSKAGIEMPSQLQEKIKAAREGVMPEPIRELQGATPDAVYH